MNLTKSARNRTYWLSFAAALLLAGCLATAAGAAGAAKLTVELPAVIEAREGEFFLGEYASFEGDPGLADAASMVQIAPKNGAFSRQDVVEALGASAVAGRSVALRMAETVTVRPESRIAAELRAISGWKWRIDVDGPAVGDTTDFSLPPRVTPGARAVAAKIAGGDTPGSRQMKLTWYQPVVYALKPLARNDRIDASSLSMRIETIGMNEDNLWSVSQLRGAVPRQAIAARRAISMGDVEQVNIVRNGSSVMLIARINGLGVEVRGIALQRGGIGDVIKVRNLSSRKILAGTVVDAGRVQLN